MSRECLNTLNLEKRRMNEDLIADPKEVTQRMGGPFLFSVGSESRKYSHVYQLQEGRFWLNVWKSQVQG